MNKEIECETCIKRKTMYCPNSSECMSREDKPFYQNRIMLLKENERLKEENFNLREGIYIEKMSFPSEERNFKELIEMPTYEELKKENEKLKERINKIDKHVSSLSSVGRGCEIYADVKREILKVVRGDNK